MQMSVMVTRALGIVTRALVMVSWALLMVSWALVMVSWPAAAFLSDRPRVHCESGHLRLDGGAGKNITLSTRGSGAVVINGVDVAGSLSLVSAVRPQLEGLHNTDLGFLVRNLTEVARTVASLTWVSRSIGSLNTTVASNTRTTATLRSEVTSIRTTLRERLDPLVTNVSRLSQQVALVTPNGGQHLQNINDLLTRLQQDATQNQQNIRNLRERTVPQIQQSVAHLQDGLAGLPELQNRIQTLESQVNSNDSISEGFNTSGRIRRSIRKLKREVDELKSSLLVDECESGPCRHGGTCIDGFQKFTCLCPSGWFGSTCDEDFDECREFYGTDLGCQNGASCRNTIGGYRCECQAGFYGIHCHLKSNNCTAASGTALCGVHGVCVPSARGRFPYACICDEGWKTGDDTPACVDVDECAVSRPHCSADPPVHCVNYPGGFTCGPCPQGYSGDGFVCRDVDECLTNNGGCSPYSICYNTLGGRRCGPCSAGYTGDGVTCHHAPSPCHRSPCHYLARCFDDPRISPTYVQCICPSGYQGQGFGFHGCSPVSTPSGGSEVQPVTNWCSVARCMNGGTCIQSQSTYTCICTPGYTGRNCEVDFDECSSNPCLHGGTCTQGVNSYTCSCPASHTGDRCQTENERCGGHIVGTGGMIAYPGARGVLYNHNISCAWLFSVPRGKVINITFNSFHLEGGNCRFDWLQIHDGRDSQDQLMGRFCGARLPGTNGTIISTHNYLYLWFRSDHSQAGYGFNFTWNATDPVCGSDLRGQEYGSINSPGYPGRYPTNRDCYWTVQVQPGKRIKFHFAILQIEHHSNCSYDFLEVRDGLTESDHSLGKYCFTQAPAPLTTSGAEAFLHFHSDASLTDTGFHISYSAEPGMPGCGGLLTNDMGEFSAPTISDEYEHNLHCEWVIRVPPEETIQLNFSDFHLENHGSCRWDYLAIRDGGSADSPLISRSCGVNIPLPVQSSGNQLHVTFHSDHSISGRGFTASYQVACGGEYGGSTGVIRSPYHPRAYPHNRECIYTISTPPRTAVILNFTDFDIEGPTFYRECVFDYVEIRDGRRASAPLLGRYCGPAQHTPDPVRSQLNHMWLKFRTDSSVSNMGFVANFTTIDIRCGEVMRALSAVVNSPNSPESYPGDTDCYWVLDLPQGYVIQLTWSTFSLENHRSCMYDYVEIFDNSSIPGMGGRMGTRYCGQQTPPIMTSSSNLVTIHFHSDSDINYDGFSLVYHGLDASRTCGGHYHSNAGMITSPNYPINYPHNRNCEWTITVASRTQIRLTFVEVEIEGSENCRYDALEIRNGKYSTSPLMKKICSRNQTVPELLSHSHQLYLKFTSDRSSSFKGFKLFWDTAATGCGGMLTAVSGEIISPGYPEPYYHNADCYWTIRVAQGSAVKLLFVDLDIENAPGCHFDFVEVRDGSSPQSPLLGRFCSSNQGFVSINSTSNSLWLRFRSDYSTNGRGFKAQYMTECNRVLRGHRGVITTPGYPDPYPHNRNCTWTILAPQGNSINASFSEFVLEDHTDPDSGQCYYDFVEIFQGQQKNPGSRSQIGHYCQNVPPPVATSSHMNTLEINFVSDHSVADNGFRLEWIVNGCGGEMTRSSGNFTSPNYPNAYPSNTDCEWFIRTVPGTKIQITIHDFDLESSGNCVFDVLHVYGGRDLSSPVLTTLCHEQSRPTTVTTQGNTALLSFHSDQSVRGKGFRASYITLPGGCGGLFTGAHGSIHSPKYPELYDVHSDCEWTIRVDPLHVVELNFTDFDIEPSANCTYDYLTVHDGEGEDAPVLMQHCGNTLPNPTLVRASANTMTVRFKADGSTSGRGFLADYTMGCGASVEVGLEDSGELMSPHYPSMYTSSLNCSWHLHAPAGYRVLLHVVHLDMHTRFPSNENCSYEYLAVLDGGQLDSPVRGRYCGNRAPRSIVSSSEYMTVSLINEYAYVSFRAVYSILTSRCGGEFTSMTGEVASPNYPEPYPVNTECEWSISAGSGNRLELNFLEFDIEQSAGCNLDYVEVHERTAAGPLLLHNCSSSNSQIPAAIIARDALWIKFHSDQSGIGARGFLASYSLLHGSDIYGTSGEVVSPLYPHTYMGRDDVTWTITVPRHKYVSIIFLDMAIEGNPVVDECFASLVIYDGRSIEGSRILGTFCGYQVPSAPVVSSWRTVAVRLNAQHHHEGSKFRFHYEAVDTRGTPGQTQLGDESNNCSFVLTLNGTAHVLQNPGYPGYANNLNCVWIIQTLPHHRVVSDIFYELEESSSCYYDRIEVYDGLEGTQNWNLTSTLCRREQNPSTFISSGRFLKIRFVTDHSVTRQGFTAYLNSICGGYLGGAEGIVASENYPEYYDTGMNCLWIIKVGLGRTIRLEFDDFRIANSTPTCGGDYLTIRNGAHETSPFLGAGKFCGRSITQDLQSSSNVIRLSFISDSSISDKGFKLRYYEQASTCGGNHRLTAEMPKLTIQSPNYPNPPNHNTECAWTILAPPEKAISLHFEDPFDITSSYDGCDQAFAEVRDGGTLTSPLLGQLCGSHVPDTQHSTGNAIYIRYYNNVSDPHSGFKAEAAIDRCGGTYNAWEDVIISSPGFPAPYSADINCTYKVVAPPGHYVALQFLDVDIFNLSENCTNHQGRLRIRDKNATGDVLGTMCSSGEDVPPINTFSNIAYITFTGGPNPANRKGFRIMFSKSLDECGGEVAGPEGEIRSPGYPHGYSSRRLCEWLITVPLGKRVRLDIIDLDLNSGTSNIRGYTYFYCIDFVQVQNGALPTSPYLSRRICSSPSEDGVFNSSMNTMRVTFKTQGHSLGRGLRARWSSDDPQECGGELTSSSGELASPGQHLGGYNHSLNCVWTVASPSNASFFVSFTYIHLEPHCFDHVLIEGVTVTGEVVLVKKVCSDFDRSSIVVPYATLKISFITDTSVNASGWNLTYGLGACGGVVHGPQSVLASPNYPAHYPNNVHCAWVLNYDEGEQIEFEFTSFRLENSRNHDYVAVYNGPRFSSPKLGHYTGRLDPFSVGPSMTNNLLVEFHTDGSTTDGGFRAVAARHVRGCGGVFHGVTGNFSSHGFPAQYEANTECEWEVDIAPGYHAVITFTDRFDIETSDGCQNDYLQIFSDKETNPHAPVRWEGGERMCGKQLPPPVNSNGSHIKLFFHTNDAVQGDGFKVSWQLVCGNNYTGSMGYIVSPDHPGNYPNNARCVYRILAPPEKYVTINFLFFEVENGRECMYDSLTVTQERTTWRRQQSRTWGPYCERNPPPAVITTRGSTALRFVSDYTISKAGFVVKFTVEGCGGNISAPGVIDLPTRPTYHHNMYCTWDITAPQGMVPHLKFQMLDLEGNYRCNYDSLSIYDGHTTQVDKLVTRLCGNHTSALPVVVGRERLARLVFRTDHNVAGSGFKATLEFTYQCGGNINISYSGASETIRSLDADNDGNYERMLDCHWLVEGLADHVVTFTFSRLNVEPPGPNSTSPCPYDGVQIYDGPSSSSPLIATHCNSTGLPAPFSSSANLMFIRFYSDSRNQLPGFTATITNTPHPCGVSNLQATNETQVLESPGYPTAYPISTRCQWVITAPEDNMDIHLEIDDFNLEASPRCSKDELFISEYDRAETVQLPINSGQDRWRSLLNFGGRQAYFSFQNKLSHGYCGSTIPHHLNSYTNALRINLRSDGDTVAPGFRLHYSIGGCNRTFNSTSGLVRTRMMGVSCFSTFMAPQGSFVNLYFNSFSISGGRNCSRDNSLKIYDGVDSSATLLVLACGWRNPNPVYSTGNALRLEFTPRISGMFDLTYATSTQGGGCGGSMFAQKLSRLTSPAYPGPAPGGLDCLFTLAVAPSNHLALSFSIIDFGSSEGCNSTFLEVYDITAAGEPSLLNTLCGHEELAKHLAPSNKMILRYVTGTGNITGQGWSVSFLPAIPHESTVFDVSGAGDSPSE